MSDETRKCGCVMGDRRITVDHCGGHYPKGPEPIPRTQPKPRGDKTIVFVFDWADMSEVREMVTFVTEDEATAFERAICDHATSDIVILRWPFDEDDILSAMQACDPGPLMASAKEWLDA